MIAPGTNKNIPLWLRFAVAAIVCLVPFCTKAALFDINLDSVAAMGRFPKFCVDTYRWADKFFNGYDSTYVAGTGYKWNIKLRTDSWDDFYKFDFGDGTSMKMRSDPSTSAGFYLTYMAVSVGYDINVSKYFGGSNRARKRWNFGFNCMLFQADLYFISNDVGTRIRELDFEGGSIKEQLDFDGINTTQWGIDIYYFFRHKKYSQAAAFNFSRIQKRSSWAPFAGFTYWRQNYDFDFSGLPEEYLEHIPVRPPDYHYKVNTHNYFARGGIGYNWVINPKWTVGLSEALMLGYTNGYIQEKENGQHTMALLNYARVSLVFNSGKWFVGTVAEARTSIVGNKNQALLNAILTLQISAGMRFNL